jgi:hypothetical protein
LFKPSKKAYEEIHIPKQPVLESEIGSLHGKSRQDDPILLCAPTGAEKVVSLFLFRFPTYMISSDMLAILSEILKPDNSKTEPLTLRHSKLPTSQSTNIGGSGYPCNSREVRCYYTKAG